MPLLIDSSASYSGSAETYYTMYGTTSYTDMLNFYVDLGAIETTVDLKDEFESKYDGYVLSLFNLNIATALTV